MGTWHILGNMGTSVALPCIRLCIRDFWGGSTYRSRDTSAAPPIFAALQYRAKDSTPNSFPPRHMDMLAARCRCNMKMYRFHGGPSSVSCTIGDGCNASSCSYLCTAWVSVVEEDQWMKNGGERDVEVQRRRTMGKKRSTGLRGNNWTFNYVIVCDCGWWLSVRLRPRGRLGPAGWDCRRRG